MDWLTFKFCVLIWILCLSKSQSQLRNSTSTNNQLRSACLEGRPVFPPNPCNTCICFSGQVHCTNLPCPEKECINDMELPKPDECNKCTCRRGKVTCTSMICIPAPLCTENQLYPAQNKCNACMCKDGFISCTSNVCVEEPMTTTTTTRKPKKKKKCEEGSRQPVLNQCFDCICQNGRRRCKNVCKPIVESQFQGPKCNPGQHIARPDDCNNCICFEGQVHCTHLPCRTDMRIGPQCTDDQQVYRPDECNECHCIEGRLECSDLVCIRGSKCDVGQVIPKPDSCNTCKCVKGYIMCTNHQCSLNSTNVLLPEFKGRLKEINEKTNLEKFDKKIPVDPFINILYTKNYKIPEKLKHSHTYNGYHQEIKVHASHSPKDTTKLLNVLANSLDNAALASISKKILTSNSVSSNQDSKKPFDLSIDKTNQLGEGNVKTAQSSKLITSGSQSNETILVFPHTEPFNDHDSQSVVPLESKHETTWKTVSAPDTLVYNNGIQILPRHIQEENGNDYNDNPPSMITPIDPNPVTRNPAKFGPPDQHYGLPTILAFDTADTPSIPTQSISLTLHPKPININDGKMIYAPFFQKNKQIKPAPSSTKSGPNHIFNHTSPTPVLRPEQYELNPVYNDGQQKPSPNPSNFYPNHGTPEQFQSKPKRIPSPLPPQYLNNPNQPIVSTDQYKSPQFGLKPAPGSSYPNNINLNSASTNLSYQKKHIATIDNEAPQFEPNSKAHHSDILNPSQNEVKTKHKQPNSPQSQLIPNPSVYYKNEYEAPKIIYENPDQDQLTPNSIISYKHTEVYDPLHTPFESGYEKHAAVTYVSEYDPNDHDDPTLVDHDLNEQHNGSLKYVYEHYLSEEDSQEFDLSKKVDHYLNTIPDLQLDRNEPHPKSIQSYLTPFGQRQNYTLYPTMTKIDKYDQHDPWNIANKQFVEYPLSPSKSKQTDIKTNQKGTHSVSPNILAIYLPKPSKPQLVFPQNNSVKEGSEDPSLPKSNDHQPPPSQTSPPQNLQTPGVFDDRGSNSGFQYSHNAYEDPRQFQPLHELSPPKLETPQNHQLPRLFDERGPTDGVQNPFNLAEDFTHPKVKLNKSSQVDAYKSMLNPQQTKDNQHIPFYSQFGPTQDQHKPGDNRGVEDEFQYAHNANEDHRGLKPFPKLPPFPPGTTHNKQTPGIFDERGSPDGLRHPSYLTENPIDSRENLHKLPLNQFGHNKKHLQGLLDDHGSADGFHYPSKSADISLHPKDKLNDLLIKYGPTENQHVPWRFDDRGSAGGLQNPPSSTRNSSFPKGSIQNLPHPILDPNQNQRLPGMFDGRGLHYPTKSAKSPFRPKYNNQYKPQNSPFTPTQKQNLPGISDDGGSMGGLQYPFNFAEDPKHSKENSNKQPKSPFDPTQTQHLPGVFDDRGFTDGFRYPSHSAKNPLQPKDNHKNPLYPQLGPNQNQHMSGVFDNRGFADGFQYPSYSAENPWQPKGNQQYPSHPQFGPNQNHHKPGVFDDRGSTDGFHYPSDSAGDPKHPYDNPYTFPESNFKQSQNQNKPSSLDQILPYISKNYYDKTENQPTSNNYKINNPVRPWMYLDHDQYKPSSFDNLPNGVHNISWSPPEDHDMVVNTVSSTRPPKFEPDYDQYKPSSFDNLFNGIHHMPRPVPNQDNNALESNDEITTSQSVFKPGQDDDHLQIEINNSTDLINSDIMQNNPNYRIKPDNVPGSLLPTDEGKFPDYYDHYYPLFIALNKLSEPSNDDSGLSSIDKLDLLPILFPDIADILNYNPSKQQDDEAPFENQAIQIIFSLKKLKSKLNQLTDNDNRILNWFKSKLNKLIQIEDNNTETTNEIDLPKILGLLSKLTSNNIKSTENILFNGFDPEIVEKIMNDFKEDAQTLTPTPRTAKTTNDTENWFHSVPTALEETQQHNTKKYPEVNLILHQPYDNVDLPPFNEADGEAGLAIDMGPEEVHSLLFPNILYPRFRHRPKDQKNECGDGTQWISNCHSCFCYFGQPMCLRMQDCKLRPFGEPMICKPYSHFKMGCYTCECNGDGVTECDATDCGIEPKGKRQGTHELNLPILHEFFDNKKTNEILQYSKFYKKLPKDCPRQNSETEYPTCERGTSWISSCHKCECHETGKHECTKINDCVLDFDSYGKPRRCKPNSKFYPKTNSMPCVECLCNDEGIPYCPGTDLKNH